MPDSLSFELDENDGLHAAWFYGGRAVGAISDWVRYTQSLDGGRTWSIPFTIDRHVEGSDHNLTDASPRMVVQGKTVHVIWAAGSSPYRNHRFSTDAGLTWSPPVHILGDLSGQAFDGLAVDRSGRVHLFTQIRYPLGIYHTYWDQNQWSTPALVYPIAEEDSPVGIGDRIHAHYTLPVIRAGNQLVLTFTDPPSDVNRRLFVMTSTMDDVLPVESLPTPVLPETPSPLPSATPTQPAPMPTPLATVPPLELARSQPLAHDPAPDLPIRVALVPTVLVLVGALIIWLRKRER
jgi:hypothetical protein